MLWSLSRLIGQQPWNAWFYLLKNHVFFFAIFVHFKVEKWKDFICLKNFCGVYFCPDYLQSFDKMFIGSHWLQKNIKNHVKLWSFSNIVGQQNLKRLFLSFKTSRFFCFVLFISNWKIKGLHMPQKVIGRSFLPEYFQTFDKMFFWSHQLQKKKYQTMWKCGDF